jgi:hypothetical protein
VLDVPRDEPLTHQEHGPVPTPPGRYEVLKQVEGTHKTLQCLEKTKGGHPKHPLYCRSGLIPTPYP